MYDFPNVGVMSLLPLLLVLLAKESHCEQQNMNMSQVMEQYISVCGHDRLCNKDEIPYRLRSNQSYQSLILCPDCSCGPQCLQNGNCCPDLFFSFPTLNCAFVNIPGYGPASPKEYLLVNDCPIGTLDTLREKCTERNMSAAEVLPYSPVTSNVNGYRITFKNKFCAACNGYTSYEQWILDMACEEFADFNYISTYEEILKMATEKRCEISFDPPSNNDAVECPVSTQQEDVITECNKHVSASTNGAYVDLVCQSGYTLLHTPPYSGGLKFRNIFCYMCNPPYYDNNVISKCNMTTLWQDFDPAIELSCEKYPLTKSTYPFKNIFCFICNRDMKDSSLFDFSATINTRYTPKSSSRFQYDISMEQVNANNLFQSQSFQKVQGEIVKQSSISSLDMYSSFELKHGLNLSNIFGKIYAYQNATFCDRSWVPNMTFDNEECKCNKQDIECIKNCCFDFAFAYPASHYSFLPSMHSKAIDGCFVDAITDELKAFKILCEKGSSSNSILGIIPATFNGFNATYMNAYCALCNERRTYFSTTDSIKNLKFYKLQLTCRIYLSINYHVTLSSIIETARKANCEEYFISPYKDFSDNQACEGILASCNFTGHMAYSDPDIKWACETSSFHRISLEGIKYYYSFLAPFKNDMCALCNPKADTNSTVINTCNQTGSWKDYNQDTDVKCRSLPRIYRLHPYKNYFCMICNGVNDIIRPVCILPPQPPTTTVFPPTAPTSATVPTSRIPPIATIRSILSLSEYINMGHSEHRKDCSSDQILDKITVRLFINITI